MSARHDTPMTFLAVQYDHDVRISDTQFCKLYNHRTRTNSLLNLGTLNLIWIVITFFRLIWRQINQKGVITIQISFNLTGFRN